MNDTVIVNLTARGRELYEAYQRHVWGDRERPPGRAGGYLRPGQVRARFQLWELAHIFGPGIYNGCTPPFELSLRVFPKERTSEGKHPGRRRKFYRGVAA